MIFGLSVSEKGIAAAVALIKPMFGVISASGKRLTPQVLRDPYIVGFLGEFIIVEASFAAGRLFQEEEAGRVCLTAWGKITGDDLSGLGQRLHDLAAARDVAYMKGVNDATKLFKLVHGKPKLDDPDVASAIEDAKRLAAAGAIYAPRDNEQGAREAHLRVPNSYYAPASILLWTKLFVERFPE